MTLCCTVLDGLEESVIGTHSAGEYNRSDIIDFCCMKEFMREDIHDCLLEFKGNLTDIFFTQISSPIYLPFHSTLESRKRKIMSLFIQEHFREYGTKLSRVFARKLPDNRSPWVPESHHLRNFVEGFSGRIIECLPYLLSLEHALPEIKLIVSTRYRQADRWERNLLCFATDEVCEHMRLDMIDRQIWFPKCLSECFCHAHPDQERRHEPWELGTRNDIYVMDGYLCLRQDILEYSEYIVRM